jgi:predicted glycosyltransferase
MLDGGRPKGVPQGLRALFDIVHPADVLFFKRPIEILAARDADILILSRHKDITCALLDEFGFSHQPTTSAGKGVFGLASELVRRETATILAARRFNPDVMIGFGGAAIALAGRILKIPAISFYDSENARLQTRLAWPFIAKLYVPETYGGPTPRGRTTRIPGTKELSYLHTSAFVPSTDIALRNGFEPGVDNFFVRVVAWRANHDLGKSGWSEETLRCVVEWLETRGRVHLSSEMPLPREFDRLIYRGSITDVHHLIGHCRLLVGESATMASEAAILGVPAIYSGYDFPGYVKELEATGLLYNLPNGSQDSLLALIERALARPIREVRALRDRYVAARPDWAQAVVEAIAHAVPAQAPIR